MITVKNLTLASADAWYAVTFDKAATKFIVKNFGANTIYATLVANDEDTKAVKIATGTNDVVYITKEGGVPTKTIYLKGTGDVEVREVNVEGIGAVNNLVGVTVVPATGNDLYGKKATDLQKDIVIENDPKAYIQKIHGTLHYVEGYTGFSGDVELQEGNYLAINIDPIVAGQIVTLKWAGGESEVALEGDDDLLVARMGEGKEVIEIKVVFENQTKVYKYDVTGLTLEEKEEE